ncbi:MAG: hypothetical protein RL591_741 [Planctomycetota bacterium]
MPIEADSSLSSMHQAERSTPPRPLFVPRGLVVLSALWIFTAWITLFGFSPPVQAQSSSYGPSIQLLFATIGVGIAIAWPMLRLAGRASQEPLTQSIFDGLAILVLLQVVLWPLRLVTAWSLSRTIALDVMLALTIVSTGALLSLASASLRARTRTFAMMVLVAIALGPPLFRATIGLAAQAFFSVDLDTPHALTAASVPAALAEFAAPRPLDTTVEDAVLVRHAAVHAAVAVSLACFAAILRAKRAESHGQSAE